jgi:kinesin family protein 11
VQMTSLDDFVTRARSQNTAHHNQHSASVQNLSSTVQGSYSSINAHCKDTFSRVEDLGSEMEATTDTAADALLPLSENLCRPLAELREDMSSTALQEYQATGNTPQKTEYNYPTDLPHTKPHSTLIRELHGVPSPSKSSSTGGIFSDADPTLSENRSPSRSHSADISFPLPDRNPLSMSLREVHPNVNSTMTFSFDPRAGTANTIHGFSASVGPGTFSASVMDNDNTLPLFKKSRTAKSRAGKKLATVAAEGRENVPPMQVLGTGGAGRAGEIFAQSVSRRKSPRLN